MKLPPSATSVVVSDAGPLISLGRIELLFVLEKLFLQVQVPHAVLEECMARPDAPDAGRIRDALAKGVLMACDAPAVQMDGLDAGESAAIARALDIGAGLLADDLAARQHALRLNLTVIGTLGVLVLAKRVGLVEEIRPAIERLRQSGQRLGQAAVAQALAAAGESA